MQCTPLRPPATQHPCPPWDGREIWGPHRSWEMEHPRANPQDTGGCSQQRRAPGAPPVPCRLRDCQPMAQHIEVTPEQNAAPQEPQKEIREQEGPHVPLPPLQQSLQPSSASGGLTAQAAAEPTSSSAGKFSGLNSEQRQAAGREQSVSIVPRLSCALEMCAPSLLASH